MLKFGNTEFRNLQEQVGKNQEDILKIKEGLGSALPDPIAGPEGPQGPQGEQGPQGRTPIIAIGSGPLPQSGYEFRDIYIASQTGNGVIKGNVYQMNDIGRWVLQLNIVGPQGLPGQDIDEVIANPEEEAIEDIEKIKIDGIVYTIRAEDVYTKEEINDIIAAIKANAFIVVDITEYPTKEDFLLSTGEEGYVYLYPIDTSDLTEGYYQYIWESNAWLLIGSTQLDLTNYPTKSGNEEITGTWTFDTGFHIKDSRHSSTYSLTDGGNGTCYFKAGNTQIANLKEDGIGVKNLSAFSDNTYDIGSATNMFKEGFFKTAVNVGTSGIIKYENSAFTFNDDLTPAVSGSYSLGTITNAWHDIILKGTSGYLWRSGTTPDGYAYQIQYSTNNGSTWNTAYSTYGTKTFIGGTVNPNASSYGLTFPDTTNFTANSELIDASSAQTITGEKTIKGKLYIETTQTGLGTGKLQIFNDNGYTAKIKFGSADNLNFSSTQVTCALNFNPTTNNSKDLGLPNVMWRNLYLAGNISDGTNSVTVAQLANLSGMSVSSGNLATTAFGTYTGTGDVRTQTFTDAITTAPYVYQIAGKQYDVTLKYMPTGGLAENTAIRIVKADLLTALGITGTVSNYFITGNGMRYSAYAGPSSVSVFEDNNYLYAIEDGEVSTEGITINIKILLA